MRYYEDFATGEKIDLGSHLVTAEEIIKFAGQFDPAPYHLSEEGGRDSLLGGLSASGWHSCAIGMRLMCDSFLLDSASQGAPGIDWCKWLAPVYAGNTLSGVATVLEKRLSRSRPGIGLIRFDFSYSTDGGKPALTLQNAIMFKCRDSGDEKQ